MSGSTFDARASVSAPAAAATRVPHAIPWVSCLWLLCLLSFALLSTALATRFAIAYTALAFLFFALPGFFLTPIFFAPDPATRLERAIFGAVIGISLSSYVAILVGYRYGWSPKATAVALVALTAVCALLGWLFRGRVNLPARPWTQADYATLAGIGLLLLLFAAIPALHFGKLTSQGYAYTWLYGHDFLYRADVVQAMTTHLPPDWYWMSGTTLRMYLVGYAVPAFAYSASGKTLSIHEVLLITTLLSGFFLLSSLYMLLRALFAEVRVLLSTLFISLVAYSYYWIFHLGRAIFVKPGQRVFGGVSSVSHNIQRALLVEPQAALATSLLLLVLLVLLLTRFRLKSFLLAVFIGICLAIAFGVEGMQGAMAILWFGLFQFACIVWRKSFREELWPFLLSVLTCAAICASFFAIGMYQRSTSHLAPFTFDPWIVKFGIPYFLLEMGPLLILGIWGAARWWRGSREELGWALLLFGAITVLQVLFVSQKPPTRMADRLLPFVLIPFVAYLFRDLWARRLGRFASLSVSCIALLAVPTFFTDIHAASNTENIWDTRYVLPADMRACRWIRQNLPETAVIQGNYNYFAGPNRGLYLSLISSFAQRPQILGWYTAAAMVVDNGWPLATERRDDLDKMFAANDLSLVVQFARKYSVDYLYVGPFETSRYPRFLSLVQSAPGQFREVYSHDGAFIFQYTAGVAK